jgi:hypothetical protein
MLQSHVRFSLPLGFFTPFRWKLMEKAVSCQLSRSSQATHCLLMHCNEMVRVRSCRPAGVHIAHTVNRCAPNQGCNGTVALPTMYQTWVLSQIKSTAKFCGC